MTRRRLLFVFGIVVACVLSVTALRLSLLNHPRFKAPAFFLNDPQLVYWDVFAVPNGDYSVQLYLVKGNETALSSVDRVHIFEHLVIKDGKLNLGIGLKEDTSLCCVAINRSVSPFFHLPPQITSSSENPFEYVPLHLSFSDMMDERVVSGRIPRGRARMRLLSTKGDNEAEAHSLVLVFVDN